MYGLSYCKLDYAYMLEMDTDILSIMIQAEIDRELHETDLHMQKLAWQTAQLMNATGNFKQQIKPDKLYIPTASNATTEKQNKPSKATATADIEAKREELLKAFE